MQLFQTLTQPSRVELNVSVTAAFIQLAPQVQRQRQKTVGPRGIVRGRTDAIVNKTGNDFVIEKQ